MTINTFLNESGTSPNLQGQYNFGGARLWFPSEENLTAAPTTSGEIRYITNSGMLVIYNGEDWTRFQMAPVVGTGLPPSEINNLFAWLRADNIETSGVSGIKTWFDNSANGNDFLGNADDPGGGTTEFPFIASGSDGINGKDACYFNGVDDRKPYFILNDSTFASADKAMTVIMTYEQGRDIDAVAAEYCLLGLGLTTDNSPFMEFGIRDSTDAWQFNRRDDADLAIVSDDGAPASQEGRQTIAAFVFDGTVYHAYIDGNEITPSSGILADVGSMGTNRISIGGLIRSSNIHFMIGKIGEVAIYESGLSNEDRRNVQKYMSDYWGIALSGTD